MLAFPEQIPLINLMRAKLIVLGIRLSKHVKAYIVAKISKLLRLPYFVPTARPIIAPAIPPRGNIAVINDTRTVYMSPHPSISPTASYMGLNAAV